jgi:hypothetical protein
MRPGWRGARRELAVATALVVTLAAAGFALAGAAVAAFVVLSSAAVAIAALRVLLSHGADEPEPAEPYRRGPTTPSLVGFWRARADLTESSRSLSSWDHGPRPRLQNLLAARLAERHGVSLAHDPETARRLRLGAGSRRDLWYWIDPQRPIPPDASDRPGIPPRVLAALIDRLEQL